MGVFNLIRCRKNKPWLIILDHEGPYVLDIYLTTMRNTLQWQPLTERRTICKALMVYRIVNDLVAIPLLERNTTSYYIISSHMSYSTIPCPIYQKRYLPHDHNVQINFFLYSKYQHAWRLPGRYYPPMVVEDCSVSLYCLGRMNACSLMCWYMGQGIICARHHRYNIPDFVSSLLTHLNNWANRNQTFHYCQNNLL
jgi:hypothetical protein